MARSMGRGTIVLMALASCLYGSFAAAEGVGMVTGSNTGTYIQFGQQIADVVSGYGLELLVKESEGSIANIRRLNSRENAALGIVQSDVLGFLGHSDSPEMQKVAKRIRMIFPFYLEEVHLFANREISGLKDLQGKRVVIGKQGSGNWLTATNLLRLAGVSPSQTLDLPPLKAVIAVLQGEADAMIYVAGKPVKLFTTLGEFRDKPEYAELFDDVQFFPLADGDLLTEYERSDIGPAEYPWLKDTVPTLAVKAVLVSFDFSGRGTPYYRERCDQLAVLGRAVRENLDQLKAEGHPKWKEVDLDAQVGIWELDTCSRTSPKAPPSKKDIAEDLEKALLQKLGQ